MVSWLIHLVFRCILEIVTSGFTNGWLWKGKGKRHKEWMASGFLRTGFLRHRSLGEYGFEHIRIKGFFTYVSGARYQVLGT